MKAVEQQQANSMDLCDSVNGGNEYAYRPLTTKHRRAGSTGTTGDEEYTTDEDDIYGDEADCSGPSLHPHPILKSDLARAATDLFGYSEKHNHEGEEPTSLFDEDEKFSPQSSTKTISLFTYNKNLLPRGVRVRPRNSDSKTFKEVEPEKEKSLKLFDLGNENKIKNEISKGNAEEKVQEEVLEFQNQNTNRPLDRRLNADTTTSIPQASTGSWSDLRPSENHATSPRKFPLSDEQNELFVEPEEKRDCSPSRSRSETPTAPSTLHWERAVAEVKEHAIAKLQEELKRAHEELKLKDEEVARLARIRQDVEAELEELTASLFQEAHNMVREANIRQATAERLLEESRMKSEVLAAEVVALKTLVLTSTPARPNPHLHPQIDTKSRNSGSSEDFQPGLFMKKHRRSPSHFNLKYGRENSPPDSPQKEQRASLPYEGSSLDNQWEKEWEREREREKEKEKEKENKDSGLEVDPRVHSEFLQWKTKPIVNKTDPFIERIFREDIDLCLDFPNLDLGSKVRQAVLDGIIFIEAVSDKTKLAFPKKCALLEAPRQCHYRMRLGDQENQWYCISHICRNRVIAVCDFLNYLRYIERGLVKSSAHDTYWEITRLRKEMVLARLGLALSS